MIIDKKYVEFNKEDIIDVIKSGAIFIYPTDTIYGMGCNALVDSSVQKIRELKNRGGKAFSVIAPNKDWIIDNCDVAGEWQLEDLPGPVTLILNTLSNSRISKYINPEGKTLGVRIPRHWFSEIIEEAGVPFVTTSVNISGEKHMETLEDVPALFLEKVDYIVYDGPIHGTSSRKIDLTK